jgi:hypothetical protein
MGFHVAGALLRAHPVEFGWHVHFLPGKVFKNEIREEREKNH